MRIAIIEDEAAAVRRLLKMLKGLVPNLQIVEETDSIETAVSWLQTGPAVDLIFLDIQLADGLSFEIFRRVEVLQPVIFTTAYDQHAIEAFQVNAIDYLLKPVKFDALKQALEKFQKLRSLPDIDYEALSKALLQRHEQRRKRFLVKLGQQFKVVDLRNVAYFYTQNKITFLVNKDGKRYPIEQSLEKLFEDLDKKCYFRINRQFIIHIEAIAAMHTFSKSRVKIDLEPPCELETVVSVERSAGFKRWLVGEDL